MIDDDVVLPADTHRLLDVDADIVFARVPVWLGQTAEDGTVHHSVTIPAGRRTPHGKFDFMFDRERGQVEVDSCGMGCILIRREVLDDPRMHLGIADDGEPILFQTVRRRDGTLESEDIDFTWRARQLGYKVVLDGSVRCGHEKTVDLADVEAWATRRRPVV
jgi:hypothetical protein